MTDFSQRESVQLKSATLFQGGALADVGIRNAGFEDVFGTEIDADIASVSRDNGFNPHVVNMLHVKAEDFASRYGEIDSLHASTPCPNFSIVRAGRSEETSEDISLAQATVDFIDVFLPKIFTLENVTKYRLSKSFAIITDCLDRLGYNWSFTLINCADFGVPQARKRLLLRAVRKGFVLPELPRPEAHVGWYPAIRDLELRSGKLTDFMLSHAPPKVLEGGIWLINTRELHGNTEGSLYTAICGDEPSYTIVRGGTNRHKVVSPVGTKTLTTRALARLMSVPDSYILPKSDGLATTILGNGVPSRMMEIVYSQLRRAVR